MRNRPPALLFRRIDGAGRMTITAQSKSKMPVWLKLAAIFGSSEWAWDIEVAREDSFVSFRQLTPLDDGLRAAVLKIHVDDDGLFDYAAMGRDGRSGEYLGRLANKDSVDQVSGEEPLAFWINAYKVLALQGVPATRPERASDWPAYSVLDVAMPGVTEKGKGFFVGLRFLVGGRRYTLDEIENMVILLRSANGAIASR